MINQSIREARSTERVSRIASFTGTQ